MKTTPVLTTSLVNDQVPGILAKSNSVSGLLGHWLALCIHLVLALFAKRVRLLAASVARNLAGNSSSRHPELLMNYPDKRIGIPLSGIWSRFGLFGLSLLP